MEGRGLDRPEGRTLEAVEPALSARLYHDLEHYEREQFQQWVLERLNEPS
jgi:hypothetical protein